MKVMNDDTLDRVRNKKGQGMDETLARVRYK